MYALEQAIFYGFAHQLGCPKKIVLDLYNYVCVHHNAEVHIILEVHARIQATASP